MRKGRDQYYLDMLELVASRGTCQRRQVGAIVTTKRGEILSTGYNGAPRGLPHCVDHPCPGVGDQKGDSSRCEAVHAEVNALLQCNRLDLAHTIYVTCTPCFHCAKMIANTNIKRIVCLEQYADQNGAAILGRANIEIVYVIR